MHRVSAIYTRQSVDRLDSISVESQVEFCKREVGCSEYAIYTDKGYSGKNTDRPAFQDLLNDIEHGKIERVVVYRLDRISRSVLDFANIIEVFQKHKVDFVSTMEKFDTSTPIGKAMLMIVMIFAQLERETIQQRVTDAYHSRSKRGFYMGGRIPYGFELVDAQIEGIRTKKYQVVEREAEIIKLIYELYAQPQTSLGDVVRELGSRNIVKRDGMPFSRARVRELICNPAYVKADYRLYEFFKANGSVVINCPEDFIGTNGGYLYSGDVKKTKSISLEGHTLVLAPHEGIVDSGKWIKCRTKSLANRRVADPTKAKCTWLAGKIKCGCCGFGLVTKEGRRKTKANKRYYLCHSKYNGYECTAGSVDADIVDDIVFERMKQKIDQFRTLKQGEQDGYSLQEVKLRTRISRIDDEISALLEKIMEANPTVMKYINDKVNELDTEKKQLTAELFQIEEQKKNSVPEIVGYMERWEELSINDKIIVVDSVIERVVVLENEIEITWKI